MRKWLIWVLVAVPIYVLLGLHVLIPMRWMSAVMGFLAPLLAPWTKWHQRAKANLQLAMPELTRTEQKRILQAMWVNLGRNIGEYPYIRTMAKGEAKGAKIEFSGGDAMHEMRQYGGFVICGHFANWEMLGIAFAQHQIPVSVIYRPFNNPLANRVLNRRAQIAEHAFPKGAPSARAIVEAPRKKRILIINADQKLREGKMIAFFGREVPTPVSYIKAALKHNFPIYMARIKRGKGSTCSVEIERLDYASIVKANPNKDPIIAIATAINAIFESWVRDCPEQWLWLHRRWQM